MSVSKRRKPKPERILNQGRLDEIAAEVAKAKIQNATYLARTFAEHMFGLDEEMPVKE